MVQIGDRHRLSLLCSITSRLYCNFNSLYRPQSKLLEEAVSGEWVTSANGKCIVLNLHFQLITDSSSRTRGQRTSEYVKVRQRSMQGWCNVTMHHTSYVWAAVPNPETRKLGVLLVRCAHQNRQRKRDDQAVTLVSRTRCF